VIEIKNRYQILCNRPGRMVREDDLNPLKVELDYSTGSAEIKIVPRNRVTFKIPEGIEIEDFKGLERRVGIWWH